MANVAPDDRELELLLTQLLRMVSPALAADDAGGKSHGGLGVMDRLRAPDPAAAAAQPAAEAAPATTSTPAYEPLPALSPSEARALIELVSARGIAQGELAALLGLDKSTVSRLAAGLERKGWIRRGRDEGNQRYVRLYLTPQGGDVAARVWQAWQSRQARMLAALSADERAGLSAGLGGLVRVLAAEGLLSESASTGTQEPAGGVATPQR
ncbi:MAG TPA: MarR family winged helix-turn-helix transcriptional regulator [Streptosporangiaceae bacterium]|nr:MarR family winged helix-turn-helix transcriptional regulator [Streptosporangiaceae bacterium]